MASEVLPFASWESFYVIVGSSAAALTGLQFVVITLIADSRIRHTQRDINAFGTPIVLHFSVVLLISGILSAPWHAISGPAVWIALVGFAGLIYSTVTSRRGRVLGKVSGAYQATWDDLLWYQFLPGLSYFGLLVAGVTLYRQHAGALYATAGLVLFLLLVSIRNAWDTVTYVAERRSRDT